MEITDPRAFHLGAVATRLARHVPLGEAVHTPITGVLCGRRNNQAEVYMCMYKCMYIHMKVCVCIYMCMFTWVYV